MAQQEIPAQWRKEVCAILATEQTGSKIRWTEDAQRRYEASASAAKIRSGDNDPVWQNEIYQPIRDFLASRQPTGCPVTMDYPPGHTFEFLFTYRGEVFYGKILLYKDRQRVMVLSAHLADFEKLSCE
jgi:hypothetical protein